MRTTALLLLLLTATLTARADNWIENGDFSTGMDHWHGDGHSPVDLARTDPFAKPDPFLSQGLIIPLKHLDWAKVEQNFRTESSTLILTVTYKISPDLAFSTNLDDYTDIPAHLKFSLFAPFNLKAGDWLIFVTDQGNKRGSYFSLTPKPGSEPQSIRAKLTGLVPFENKDFCLAFPPGTGTVVLLNVSLTDVDDGTVPITAPAAQ